MKKLLTFSAILLLSVSANAGQRDFNKLDSDGNKKLSLAEFLVNIKAIKIEKMTKIFNNRDKNEDGFLAFDEYKLHDGV
mgnify:CR=1 FL=1